MTAVEAAATPILGSTLPRIWTKPLIQGPPGPCGCGCALDETTSYGFDVADFARHVLGTPLDPWQRFLVIHAGELLPDGRPRFRTVLAIIARQQGKSFLLSVLILFWMFVEQQPLILATSTDRGYAKRAWMTTVDTAKGNPHLAAELAPNPTTLQIGEEEFRVGRSKYRFAAVNRRTGRSLTIHRLVLDEIREHTSFDAWGASTNAMNAVPDAQVWAVSNQGDDQSVVLDWLRDAALAYLEHDTGDPRLGIFEWSAPPGSKPDDPQALCAANPSVGRGRTDLETLIGSARQAMTGDAEALTKHKTEVMCMRVAKLDPAIDPDAWDACGTDTPIDLSVHRRKVALCVDVSLDGTHASLVAAAQLDGVVHTEVVAAWDGRDCTQHLRAALPGVVERVKPGVVGWFPNGPAAAVTAELADRKGNRTWPPRYVKVEEIRGGVTAVCMGLADLVLAGDVLHPKDPMLTAHIGAAERLFRGDAWVFGRKGVGAIDGAYALAGAVHLARTMAIQPAPKVVTRKGDRGLRPVH